MDNANEWRTRLPLVFCYNRLQARDPIYTNEMSRLDQDERSVLGLCKWTTHVGLCRTWRYIVMPIPPFLEKRKKKILPFYQRECLLTRLPHIKRIRLGSMRSSHLPFEMH